MQAASSIGLTVCRNPVLEESYASCSIPDGRGGILPMNVYIPRTLGDYLYSIVRYYRPKVTLEVGMANGLSTLFIAQALQDNGDGHHFAIDPFQMTEWRGAGLSMLRTAKLDHRVDWIEQMSHQALPQLELTGVRAGFVFIDGSHLFDYVLSDFLCADRLLEIGGIMAFDDSDWPSVRAVLRYALTNRHYDAPFSDVEIEGERYTPTVMTRTVRAAARKSPRLARKLRPEVVVPSYELGIRGRCVAIRKLAHDDRDSQSRFHVAF